MDGAQGPPVLTATAFSSTLHLCRGQDRENSAKAEVYETEGDVQIVGRGKRRTGRGHEGGGGEWKSCQRRESSQSSSFPVTQPPRSGFTDLFLPHRPCPVPLHGGRYSFLPWPAFIRSQSAWACGNYPGPCHCCSPDLDEQSHEGLIKWRRGTQIHLIPPCE